MTPAPTPPTTNRKAPSFWCRLSHEDYWWMRGRLVECQKCGARWMVGT